MEVSPDSTGSNGDKKSITASTSGSASSSTASDEDLEYGCCRARPPWLQWLNRIGWAVVFISFANCNQSLANGLFGVSLSTMEKRFDLTSSQSSWIASAYEIGPIPVLILLSLLGSRVHRPIAVTLGLLSVALGSVLFFIPQFTSPAYYPRGGAKIDSLCSVNKTSTSLCDDETESLSYYLPLFIVARLLIGMGSTPILTVALNYMDDCSTRAKFATYCGVFMAMSVIGPALGFVFGATTLELFTDFYLFSSDEIGIDSSDPRWVGCWWLPYAVTAGLSLLNALPMWGFPNDLPGAAEIRANRVSEAHNAQADEIAPSQLTYARSWKEFKALVKSVFSNPTYLLISLFSACDNFIVAGFTAFGPKYFEFGFAMTPTVAGVLFGVVLLPAGAGGTIVSGLVIEKLRLSCRTILRIEALLAGIITAGCFLFLLACESVDFAGVNAYYNTSLTGDKIPFSLNDTCNSNCLCDISFYDPICSHDTVQYYSPCFAGCQQEFKTSSEKTYYNCSCITTPAEGPTATGGVCSSGICNEAIVFLVGYFLAVFLIFCCITANTTATLRCVSSSETTFALSMQVLAIKLLGTIPGPLLMGVAFDDTCILWQPLACQSDVRGSCMFYDNKQLANNFLILMLVLKFVSFVAMIFANVFYKPPKIDDADVIVDVDIKANSAEDGKEAIEDKSTSGDVVVERRELEDDGDMQRGTDTKLQFLGTSNESFTADDVCHF